MDTRFTNAERECIFLFLESEHGWPVGSSSRKAAVEEACFAHWP